MLSEILSGKTLAVLDVDESHILSNLKKRIRHFYKEKDILDHLEDVFIPEPNTSPSVALIHFSSPTGVRAILEGKLSNPSREERDGKVRLSGVLRLGKHQLTVTGCLVGEEESSEGSSGELEDPTQPVPRLPSPSPSRSPPMDQEEESTAPLFFIFTLLFCRPKTATPVRGRVRKDFVLTPYIVYQILGEAFQPREIEVLPQGEDPRPDGRSSDVTHVLVRVPSHLVNDIIEQYDHSYVELMSPPALGSSGGPSSSSTQKCEVRYRVFVHTSGRYLKAGGNSLTEMVLPAPSDGGEAPVDTSLVSFSRRWCEDFGQPGLPSSESQPPRAAKQFKPEEPTRPTSHYHDNTPPADHNNRHLPLYSGGGGVSGRYLAPPSSVALAQPRYEAPFYPSVPAVSYAPPVAPISIHRDHLGPLPLHWRPIFSEEYKQTYYAYTNPLTREETTTWTRPT